MNILSMLVFQKLLSINEVWLPWLSSGTKNLTHSTKVNVNKFPNYILELRARACNSWEIDALIWQCLRWSSKYLELALVWANLTWQCWKWDMKGGMVLRLMLSKDSGVRWAKCPKQLVSHIRMCVVTMKNQLQMSKCIVFCDIAYNCL